MELHPTPFPVKSRYMKPKSTSVISEAPKINAKTRSSLLMEKRVFGTTRNPNIPSKTAPEKPAKRKPTSGMLKKAAKSYLEPRSPTPVAEAKNSSEKNLARSKKKSVCFQGNEAESNKKISPDGNALEPQTPAKSPSVAAKPRRSSTPYHTADKCSKCRFDKLETSAYWLGQIKLAESVGKHSVSAAFFRLASDCKAEPSRNIRVELKKYLARHEYLRGYEEWRKLSVSYGLAKEVSVNEGDVEAGGEEEKASVQNEEDKDLQKEIAEENET